MPNKVDRINHLLSASAMLRDQLEAMALEFCAIHNAKPGTEDYEDLLGVILDGDNYKRVMLDIRKRHIERSKQRKGH